MNITTLATALVFCIMFVLAGPAQDVPADVPAKLVSAPPFQISAEDEARGIDGTMKLAVDVDKTGSVKRAAVFIAPSWPCKGGLEERVTAVMRDAEKAALGFKFSPAIKKGKPVESQAGLMFVIGRAARTSKETKPAAPQDPPPKPTVVNVGVVNGKALSLPKPEYPDAAKAVHESGSVTVQVLIDEKGGVLNAQAIEGSSLLQFAARAAACEAKFSPTLLQGRPVKVAGTIIYNFVP